MSDLPTLIVPHDWMMPTPVRIDGDLPMVFDVKQDHSYEWRPLRAGDRVTLATMPPRYEPHPEPFATATVAKVRPHVVNSRRRGFYVTVTEVEAL